MSIDPRVKYVGVSKLRQLNADALRKLGDTVFVLQDSDGPIAVLLSYKMFMQIQDAAQAGERR
jgi:hypothetical protein